jgi:hypothetical protein
MARTKATRRGYDYGEVVDAVNRVRAETRARIEYMTVQQIAAAFAKTTGIRERLRTSKASHVKMYVSCSDRELRYLQREANGIWFDGVLPECLGRGTREEQILRQENLRNSTSAENVNRIVANLTIEQLEDIAFHHIQESIRHGGYSHSQKRHRRY